MNQKTAIDSNSSQATHTLFIQLHAGYFMHINRKDYTCPEFYYICKTFYFVTFQGETGF